MLQHLVKQGSGFVECVSNIQTICASISRKYLNNNSLKLPTFPLKIEIVPSPIKACHTTMTTHKSHRSSKSLNLVIL